jgi:hypothetical protein
LIGFTPIDDLGVPRDERHPGLIARPPHRTDDPLEVGQGKTFFENECRRNVQRTGAADRQIVDRPVNCQAANIAAGEEDRPYDEGIRGQREPR